MDPSQFASKGQVIVGVKLTKTKMASNSCRDPETGFRRVHMVLEGSIIKRGEEKEMMMPPIPVQLETEVKEETPLLRTPRQKTPAAAA